MAESDAWLVSTKRRTERKWGARIVQTAKLSERRRGQSRFNLDDLFN